MSINPPNSLFKWLFFALKTKFYVFQLTKSYKIWQLFEWVWTDFRFIFPIFWNVFVDISLLFNSWRIFFEGKSSWIYVLFGWNKEIESCERPPQAAWWSFLPGFSTGRALTALPGLSEVRARRQALSADAWSVASSSGDERYSGLLRPGGPLRAWLCQHQAAGRMLPSCNHRWHTQSTFPDRLSCPSSWAWGKRRRKNNTSPGSGNVASTNTVEKIKAESAATLEVRQPHPATMTCQSTQTLFSLTVQNSSCVKSAHISSGNPSVLRPHHCLTLRDPRWVSSHHKQEALFQDITKTKAL